MGIRQLDQQRQENHKQFINKIEEFIFEVKELKEYIVKTTNEQEAKSKFGLDETNKAYDVRFSKLQNTIRTLQRSNSANKTIEEILKIWKDVYTNVLHPQISTINDLNGQMLIQFKKTYEKLN